MRVEYDRTACTGWFQCIQEWDALSMNMAEGKADFDGAEERESGVFVRDVPEDAEAAAKAAAESCPVDAIAVYEDGEQIVPDSE
jgi:ferredoxin